MKKSLPILLFALALVLLLMGCTAEERYEAQLYATLYARDGVVPPTKYLTLAAEHLGMTVPLATPTPAFPQTPTMSFYEFSGTQVAQQQSVNLTQSANELRMEQERLAAEARAAAAATQAMFAQQTAQAYSQNLTAEARVWFAQQTAAAQATADMGTVIAASTATAWQWGIDQSNTQVAAASTNAVLPTHAIWTQDAVHALATIEQGEADKVALAVKRQAAKNYFDAYLPWAIIMGAFYVVGRALVTYVKIRIHPRDEHGRTQTFTRELPDGGVVMLKPEQLESGVVKVTGQGDVIRYAPIDKQEQSDINRRAQAIEAIAALPTPYAQKGAQILGTEFSRNTPRVNFNNSSSMNPVLDEADSQFLESSDE